MPLTRRPWKIPERDAALSGRALTERFDAIGIERDFTALAPITASWLLKAEEGLLTID